jgi:ferredoxin
MLEALRYNIEKALFGVSLDEMMAQIRTLSRSVEDMSARFDRRMANLRKDLRTLENGGPDPRDGLYIVEDDCISCQVCTDVAPDTFRMRQDGIAEVFNPYGSDITFIHDAIHNCGGSCIKLV